MKKYRNIKTLKLLIVLAGLIIMTSNNIFAATYYSRATGVWGINTTWSLVSGGAAVGVGIWPVAGDIVYIERGFNVTINGTYACGAIQLAGSAVGNGTLTFNAGSQLTATTVTLGNSTRTGTIIMTLGGTLICNSITNAGTGVNVFTRGSGTVQLTAINSLPNSAVFNNFNNLIINGGTTTLTRNVTIYGNLSVTSGTLALSSFTIARNAAGGSITVSNGATLSIGGTNSFPANYTVHTLGVSSTVDYSGTNQTIASKSYGNLTISGSGTKTINAATTIYGNLLLSAGTFTMSGSWDYKVVGNFTSAVGTTFNQNNDWLPSNRILEVGGNFELSGSYNSTTTPCLNLYGSGSKNFKALGLYFVLFEDGDYTCTGNVSFTNQFWAMYNTTGSFHTGAYTVTGTGATGILYNCKGTVYVENGGSIITDVAIYNGVPNGMGGAFSGPGTLNINSGGTLTTAGFYNSKGASTTVAGNLNVTTQLVNGNYVGALSTISVEDGGILTSNSHIINGRFGDGTINISNAGTIIAGGMCNGKYPNGNTSLPAEGSGLSVGTLTCTGNATINIINTPTQWYCWSDFGTFTAATSTVTFSGSGNGYILENAGSSFNDLVIDKTAGNNILSLTALHVDNDFALSSGEFAINGALNMYVGRDWFQSGSSDFTPSTSTVTFDGTSSAITSSSTGDVAFYHLVVNDVASLGDDLYVNGNLTINNSLTASKGNYSITLKGNWTNNGTFTRELGTTTFSGTSTQTIDGTNTTEYYDFVADNAAGIDLNKTITAENSLALNSGMINTGANEVIVTSTNTGAITGHQPAGAISSTMVNGNLRRYVSSSGSYDFPIGTGTYYELATLNLLSTSGMTNILAKFTTPVAPTDISTLGLTVDGTEITDLLDYGYWTITPDAGTATYDVTLTSYGHTNGGDAPDWHTIVKRANSSSDWASYEANHDNSTQSGFGINPITATLTNMSGFSDFDVAKNKKGTLPIELSDFSASCNNNIATINWSTASETNNDFFTLEKSNDAEKWDVLKIVSAAGNSNSTNHYSVTDNEPYSGNTYYRLKQTDYDGAYTYSKTISLNCGSQEIELVSVSYGENNNDVVLLLAANANDNFSFRLFDSKGQQIIAKSVMALSNGTIEIPIPSDNLGTGIYLITLQNSEKYFGEKILLQ
jgi:hypothetical protein